MNKTHQNKTIKKYNKENVFGLIKVVGGAWDLIEVGSGAPPQVLYGVNLHCLLLICLL